MVLKNSPGDNESKIHDRVCQKGDQGWEQQSRPGCSSTTYRQESIASSDHAECDLGMVEHCACGCYLAPPLTAVSGPQQGHCASGNRTPKIGGGEQHREIYRDLYAPADRDRN